VRKIVAIESVALISPLGETIEAAWEAIRAGRRLADRGVISDQIYKKITADAPSTLDQMDRSIVLAWGACRQAIAVAGWTADLVCDPDTALFIATSKGPILAVLAGCEVLHNNGPAALPQRLATQIALGPAATGLLVAEALGMKGFVHTSVAACAGSLAAVHLAHRALATNQCRRAIIAATAASVHPFFEQSFKNLGVWPAPAPDGRRYCEPFATSGGGFFITEGAAAMCLSISSGNPQVGIEKTWLGADSKNLIATDPIGLSLSRGIKFCAGEDHVDFVHAHATGTQHDRQELAVIRKICGPEVKVFSHKFWLGHLLGASGLAALALSAMCHWRNSTPGGETLRKDSRSITIAQGFGGHIGVCALAART
jgi:3-oxoacyl-(acyl-carrier-protein) synthase